MLITITSPIELYEILDKLQKYDFLSLSKTLLITHAILGYLGSYLFFSFIIAIDSRLGSLSFSNSPLVLNI